MKYIICFLFIVIGMSATVQAQTAEEIVANYIETIGGEEKLDALTGIKIVSNMQMNMGGNGMSMTMTTVQLKDGRQYTEMDMMGKEMKMGVFDGEKMWSTNFMSQKAEESTTEDTKNFLVNEKNDFPDPFHRYEEKGYSLELVGKETVEGIETFKIKLIKNPIIVDGKEKENTVIYYFETENFVPIAQDLSEDAGPFGRMRRPGGNLGEKTMSALSEYQEVDGIYFPFSRTLGRGTIAVKEIILNPDVRDEEFNMKN